MENLAYLLVQSNKFVNTREINRVNRQAKESEDQHQNDKSDKKDGYFLKQ